MVLTASQTTAFFENANQMAIPHATVIQLQNEGILTVADLVDFDKDTLSQIAENLRRPGGRIPDPNPAAPTGTSIPSPPFVFGAKSQMRLRAACDLIRCYRMTGRTLTATNIQWDPVMSRFKELWNAIKERRKAVEPDTPLISKALPIIRWTEAFQDHLHRCIGVRNIPLAYVTRKEESVAGTAPALATDQPFSTEHGSLEAELIARASLSDGLFPDDSALVYYKLEEATRGTSYADSIKPFQRKKDGRGANLALINQYAGTDKWEAEIKKQSTLLHTRKWKGQSNFMLERFIQQHRNAFVSMQACSMHVAFQLPNEHTRVGFLLDGIENDDAGLQAAIANVEDDNSVNGKRNDFEKASSHLLPKDPVVKKRNLQVKRGAAEISEMTATAGNQKKEEKKGGTKVGIGKSGVHLRYHTPDEYDNLSRPQKKELSLWRNGPGHNPKKRPKKAVAGAVKVQKETVFNDEAKEYIMSLMTEKNKPIEIAAAVTDDKNSAVADAKAGSENLNPDTKNILREILRRAKG